MVNLAEQAQDEQEAEAKRPSTEAQLDRLMDGYPADFWPGFDSRASWLVHFGLG